MARLVYLLSPAKTLDLSAPALRSTSQPTLLADAHALVKQLQKLSQTKVKALLGVSDALAKLNYDRFQSFEFDTKVTEPNDTFKQAALAFNGPAYLGLTASELSDTDLTYAQDHLVILCGLYGVLRPLDLIQPYRLEMGQKFANERGKDLYAFWGSTIAEQLNAQFSRLSSQAKDGDGGEKIIVNVASQEYFKSVQLDALDSDVRVVDCVFQDDGKIKSVYAKRARGLMCRYLIERRVDSLDGVREFNLEGYEYSPRASNDSTLVFNRSANAAKQALAASKKTKAPAKKAASKQVKDEPVKKKEENEGDENTSLRRSTRKKRKTMA